MVGYFLFRITLKVHTFDHLPTGRRQFFYQLSDTKCFDRSRVRGNTRILIYEICEIFNLLVFIFLGIIKENKTSEIWLNTDFLVLQIGGIPAGK